MDTQSALFDLGPAKPRRRPSKPLVEIGAPLWTADKSRLIDEYIHHLLLITKHGVYLDLFAGPQRPTDTENWSVRRVLRRRTEGPAIRHYAVCDKNPRQVRRLQDVGRDHRSFRVYGGDANEHVHAMLRDAPITSKTACFCLVDQRTFQCHWATVEAVARHKREGYKIELFYFLAQGWIDRAWASTRDAWRLAAWWGNSNYEQFRALQSVARAQFFCKRFRDELGYAYSVPFAIRQQGKGSRTMYYMIHASDHPEACSLMSRAYALVQPRVNAVDQLLPFPSIPCAPTDVPGAAQTVSRRQNAVGRLGPVPV